jgi:subtilisin
MDQATLSVRLGVPIERTLPGIGGVQVSVPDTATLARLRTDPLVARVELDTWQPLNYAPMTPATVGEQRMPTGLAQLRVPEAWAYLSRRGTGMRVGVMDTGIDPTHPDLRVVAGYNAVTRRTAPEDWRDDLSVCGGHGTHVAGTIAARDNGVGVVGVAPDADLYAIRIFEVVDGQCGAFLSSQLEGIRWAIDAGMHLLNLSLAGTPSVLFTDLLAQADAAGMVVVAAAGNEGGVLAFPADMPSTVAVGSVDARNQLSLFSSRGPALDVVAPGQQVLSTLPGGRYGQLDGTSMATPHVTGLLALWGSVVDVRPSPAAWRARLAKGAIDLGVPGRDSLTGVGLPQAEAMLTDDTLPIPLRQRLTATGQRTVMRVGEPPTEGRVGVVLTGTGASTARWQATASAAWLSLDANTGRGADDVRWSRTAGDLPAGRYVDTLRIGVLERPPLAFVDTVDVVALSADTTVAALVPRATRRRVYGPDPSPVRDSARVTLWGQPLPGARWRIAATDGATPEAVEGELAQWVRWTTQVRDSTPGTRLVRVQVAILDSTATVRTITTREDTLLVRARADRPELVVAIAPSVQRRLRGDTAAVPDSAVIQITGPDALEVDWVARPFGDALEIETPRGRGPGAVRWRRTMPASVDRADTLVLEASGLTPVVLVARQEVLALEQLRAALTPQLRIGTGVPTDTIVAREEFVRLTTPARVVRAPSWWRDSGELRPLGLGLRGRLAPVEVGVVQDTFTLALPTVPGASVLEVPEWILRWPAAALTLEDLVVGLFDPTRVSREERALVDGLGNRNGSYDVGDVARVAALLRLAWPRGAVGPGS